MTWVRLDDHFDEHPKMVEAGAVARDLLVSALCYCNRNLTDGFVPENVAYRILDGNGDEALMVLLHLGVFVAVDRGYEIHDFFDYQPSKEEVLAKRSKATERKRKSRGMSRRDSARSHTTPVPVPVLPSEVIESANALSSDIRKIYDHWRESRGKTRSTYEKMADSRASIIRARLKDGYTVEQCFAAIDAVALDPWPERHLHDDVKYILGPTKIDGWLDLASGEHPASNPEAMKQARAEAQMREINARMRAANERRANGNR